jgi:hypothetical protein
MRFHSAAVMAQRIAERAENACDEDRQSATSNAEDCHGVIRRVNCRRSRQAEISQIATVCCERSEAIAWAPCPETPLGLPVRRSTHSVKSRGSTSFTAASRRRRR